MELQKRPDWLLDELAHAGRENVEAEHARHYDAKMDSDAASEFELLAALGLGSVSTFIEFGTGTGQLAVEAAQRGARVVAVDVSPVMLAVLRTKIRQLGLSRLEVVEAGFLSYETEPDTVDFAYSRFALHHLPDFWKVGALQRVFRMLKPGGVFRLSDVVYNFEPSVAAERIEQWCSTGRAVLPGTAVDNGWGRWEIAEHVRDEHSTYCWLLEAMIERVGFVIEHCEKPTDFDAKYVLRKPS